MRLAVPIKPHNWQYRLWQCRCKWSLDAAVAHSHVHASNASIAHFSAPKYLAELQNPTMP